MSTALLDSSLPERSSLYSLLPMCLGTPSSEGLPSLLMRLAEAHSLLLSVLFSRLVAPLLGNDSLLEILQRGSGRVYARTANFLGTSDFTLKLVLALEKLTSCLDLMFLTLLPWREVIDGKGLFRDYRVWCPECLESFRRNNEIVYDPLIRSLRFIPVCEQHQRRLQSICFECGQVQQPLTQTSIVGYCSTCKSWLGNDAQHDNSVPLLSEFDLWQLQNTMQMIASAPNLTYTPLRETLHNALSEYIDQFFRGNASAFGRSFAIPLATSKRWYARTSLPSLAHLMQITYLTDTPLTELLVRGNLNKRCTSRAIPCKLKDAPSVSRRAFDQGKVENYLKTVLKKSGVPLTVREVAEHLGHTKRTLYHHYPVLCKAIAARASHYREASSRARTQQLSLFVQRTVEQLHFSDVYPSYARVEAAATSLKGILREKEVRKAWREKKIQLGLW